jgi:hypothetical protein
MILTTQFFFAVGDGTGLAELRRTVVRADGARHGVRLGRRRGGADECQSTQRNERTTSKIRRRMRVFWIVECPPGEVASTSRQRSAAADAVAQVHDALRGVHFAARASHHASTATALRDAASPAVSCGGTSLRVHNAQTS